MTGRAHLLHIAPSFAPGGAEVRTAQIISRTSDRFRHSVVALNGDFRAADRIEVGDVRTLACPKTRNPLGMIARLCSLMRKERPDLVLTYNWGSIDGVLAALLTASAGPVIHTEDGFNSDEAAGQKRRRILLRRFALRRSFRVVAPSRTLLRVMRQLWKLPENLLTWLPNGIDSQFFQPPQERSHRDEVRVGTVGNLLPVKQHGRLIEACASIARSRSVRLIVAGDGPERAALEEKARALGFDGRVSFLGHQTDVRKVYHDIDVLAVASSTEQMPLSVLEAMACGLPIVSHDVGDIAEMVAPENRPFVTQPGPSFEQALVRLCDQEPLRRAIGASNRDHCVRTFDIGRMIERYQDLYSEALQKGRGPCETA